MNLVLRSRFRHDVQALAGEVEVARQRQDFSVGAYGHCISLPAKDDLPRRYRTHHNNLPFSNSLQSCPNFAAIFESLEADKAAFRLLRRSPHSAYGLHDDRDKGRNVLRFQIPIITNRESFIVVAKPGSRREKLAQQISPFGNGSDCDFGFDFRRLHEVFPESFDCYDFEPGYLYFFDTDRIHTAINAGRSERIVLGIDLEENEWLRKWMATQLVTPVAPVTPQDLPECQWDWDALRHGLISPDPVEAAPIS